MQEGRSTCSGQEIKVGDSRGLSTDKSNQKIRMLGHDPRQVPPSKRKELGPCYSIWDVESLLRHNGVNDWPFLNHTLDWERHRLRLEGNCVPPPPLELARRGGELDLRRFMTRMTRQPMARSKEETEVLLNEAVWMSCVPSAQFRRFTSLDSNGHRLGRSHIPVSCSRNWN
ncbi:hypothetical protein K491DRAFT_326149 [Lophiostoma macrostomum CBS 122681]|uniref:Uncharacterized protein n=1 Tax=Lophiostoma macrostomum CBS 122681 TaxID=1314788 RepID=A0A6A6TEG1_9PLEO|nr:hypothetical protein K491DRAFT_326149 [Lophiostoma macrostomum CBS 122681]